MSGVSAQVYVPPDPYGDAGHGFTPLRQHAGQVLRTDGTPLADCAYYYERTPIGIFLRNKSLVSYTLAALHHDSTTTDTLYRIDMLMGDKEVDPVPVGPALEGVTNYYLGSFSAEGVEGHQRVVYEEAWEKTDIHYYYGSTGPRMAIVIRPGGTPADVKLSFTGQDSIKVDWLGALKVHLADKWVKLDQALAFQVNGNGQVVPVNWTADYVVEPGNFTVGFEYESYNPAWPLILQIGYPPAMMGGGPEQRNLNWSTYAGGQGGDELECVEVDEQGNPYACGYVTGTYFPIAVGYTEHTPFISEPAGWWSAVIMKVRASDKVTQWATYYGGYDGGKWSARTKAHKLAVDATEESSVDHVFVTGSTNCTDFLPYTDPSSVFTDAFAEAYDGGTMRMWVGAFRKENGIRDWATTHGQSGEVSWSEHGLAIDVDPTGQVVVGGQIETFSIMGASTPDFPLVTPTGAFSRAVGGGFFIVFDADYDIEWATTFGEYDPEDAYTKVTDLRIAPVPGSGKKVIWLTGTSSTGTGSALDTQSLPGAFFQSSSNGPSAMIARIDINNQYQVEYCTRWGDWLAEAYGLELTSKSLWVVGYTTDTELTKDHCPHPDGSGVHHSQSHAGTTYGQGADGFILRFHLAPFDLNYGTLIGGLRDDVLLDVNSHDDSRVFITGETRSAEGFSTDINSSYYYQDQNDYWNRRDAIILSLADQPAPAMLWRSAFGGVQSDRGWGIAASATEVYLVGATASQQTDAFPLWDFDPNNDLDLYQDWNLGGNTSISMVPFYQFSAAMDHEFTTIAYPELLSTPHDGFISSFGAQLSVGLPEAAMPAQMQGTLLLTPFAQSAWMASLPDDETWVIQVFDAAGREVTLAEEARQQHVLDLSPHAAGLYVVRAVSASGSSLHAKLARR
ncbi:MAG: hypothetical protein QY325_14810 [Flavobacteriales bacterium]|nr:MAG: hypothetical protein QY325_14810 [Flavobacteriales bacterium]